MKGKEGQRHRGERETDTHRADKKTPSVVVVATKQQTLCLDVKFIICIATDRCIFKYSLSLASKANRHVRLNFYRNYRKMLQEIGHKTQILKSQCNLRTLFKCH